MNPLEKHMIIIIVRLPIRNALRVRARVRVDVRALTVTQFRNEPLLYKLMTHNIDAV